MDKDLAYIFDQIDQATGGTIQAYNTPDNSWLIRIDIKQTLTMYAEGETLKKGIESLKKGLEAHNAKTAVT